MDEMNDHWNVPEAPARPGSRVARIGRPAALVAGGVVAGAVLAGALPAGAETATGASTGPTVTRTNTPGARSVGRATLQ
jgi:hypothetical protein